MAAIAKNIIQLQLSTRRRKPTWQRPSTWYSFLVLFGKTNTRLMDGWNDFRNWMTINKLKLNTDKTELAVFYSKFRAKPDLFSIKVWDQIIHPKMSLKNIGAIFDETVSMLPQVNSICKSAFFHLRSISRIRKYLSRTATERLVHAFVTSKLDSYNSLLYGLSKYCIQKLQSVLNAAARLLTYT